MGAELLTYLDKKCKIEWKIAFLSTFIIGFLIHIFRFVNILPNHDSLLNFYSNQNMLGSGRWFLTVACCLSSFYDLPWVIGLNSLLYIALTAVIIVDMFRIKNPILILLTGGMLVSFPAVVDTVYFQFTADGFMLAMLLAAAGAALTRIDVREGIAAKTVVLRYLTGGILITLACGIYQAYLSFALILAICCFMLELLRGERTLRDCLNWVWKQALLYIGALGVYYLIWQVCMKIQGCVPTHYLGIDKVGMLNVQGIKAGLGDTVVSVIEFFLGADIWSGVVSLYTLLNVVFLLMAVYAVIVCCFRTGLMKDPGRLALLMLCIAALPLAAYIWYFTTRQLIYSPRMLQSMCLIYLFVAVVYEHWFKPRGSNWMALLLCLMILNNSLTANNYYNLMSRCYEKSYATAVEMKTRIHMIDDGTVTSVAILGCTDATDDRDWVSASDSQSMGILGRPETTLMTDELHIALFLSEYTDFSLSYYVENDLEYPRITEGADSLHGKGYEFYFPLADKQTRQKLEQSALVDAMPLWPAAGSVQRIGDTIVIKLAPLEGTA